MFLRSLSMKGFKSFADPTVLEFEPGITVVVGPNGSGKSNVVDAVTWVLGAQGPRSLRSQKMEDVIFAGTASRSALGRAEVSLTIDNASGRLPVDMAEVTITRTLFRSGDSEYAINGTPCRLLDIQELLSDSGVGRQQHMIIGQGQLDTVLNARPEDRRAIIEEAAGVLKHRRRRERAERRLAATQENLERLGDLVREVRRQIRPLERQAAAARSHATVAAELLAIRRHLAGVELTGLAARGQQASAQLAQFAAEEQTLQSGLAALDEAARTTAAELSSRREEDLASALGRVQGLVERARGTVGVVRERSRALQGALDAAADVDVVSTLEAEGARLVEELSSVDEDLLALAPERQELEAADALAESAERAHLERFGTGDEVGLAEEALARAVVRRDALARELDHAREALSAHDARLGGLAARAEELSSTSAALSAQLAEVELEGARLAAALAEATAAAERATAANNDAQGASDRAEQARHRTAARAEALARALSDLQGAGGREALADLKGVVGALVDLVEIDAGWEQAFEAAVGASVAAVVVDGREAAREALASLYRQGAVGAVLATRGEAASFDPGVLPSGAESLRPHVRARSGATGPGIGGVLDALVGGAVRVQGWEQAIDVALDHPDLVVVTTEGDRFASSGWRVRSGRQGVVTAAAVEAAAAAAEAASEAGDRAAGALAAARGANEQARQAAIAAGRAVDRHATDRRTLEADVARVAADRAKLSSESETAHEARSAAAAAVVEAEQALAEVATSIPALEQALLVASTRAAEAAEAQGVLEARRRELSERQQALSVRQAGLAERRAVLAERRGEVERRLEGHAEEREQAAVRRERLEAEGRALERLGVLAAAEGDRLEGVLDDLRRDYRTQVEAVRAGGERLELLRSDRASAERRLTEVREHIRTAELAAAEVALRTDALATTVRRDLGNEPEDLLEAPSPELPEGTTAVARERHLAETLTALGPVNPLALEELSVLEERHRDLDRQVEDIRSARRELQEVVRTLDDEIMQSFATAAADVNEHFSNLVGMLFPGGVGRLTLTEPDDLLNTGVEIEVRPMGRNVRRVSLLSGGERSLAALAFLFAVFRSRPSPFYLMDEVEAALDDVNLHRFLGLVREFRAEAQLIIVSHQKRTMETGDALYGVTMAPGGSSQVVSQKVPTRPEVPTPS